MKVTCVGGGPGGLMLAILAARDGHDVTLVERQPPAESFGWGVTFYDNLLQQLDHHDADTAALIREHACTWHDLIVEFGGESLTTPTQGYSFRRRLLLELLRDRAAALGVIIEDRLFDQTAADLADSDLIVAADGVGSRLRNAESGFGTRLDRRRNHYLWLGTEREFDAFTCAFVQRPEGWLWAYGYRFDSGASTFVVELAPRTWQALGFDHHTLEESLAMLETYFAETLRGERLHPQAGTRDRLLWNNFVVVHNRTWRVGNVVLLGDAAHTTHFSIGSGTRLAMEDAMVLAESLRVAPQLDDALARYESIRQPAVSTLQRGATRSAQWYEQLSRYVDQSPADFARLMDQRRSPVMPVLPVPLYLALSGAASRAPGVAAPLRKLVSRF